jgi:hypothetical protein
MTGHEVEGARRHGEMESLQHEEDAGVNEPQNKAGEDRQITRPVRRQ